MTNLEEQVVAKNKRWVRYTDGTVALLSGGVEIIDREIQEVVALDNLEDRDFIELEPIVGDIDVRKTPKMVDIRHRETGKLLKRIRR